MKRATAVPMRHAVWLAAICLLCACAPQQPLPPLDTAAVDAKTSAQVLPDEYYRHAQAQGERVLRVDGRHSLVVLEVRRGGPFARLGHDHVVASHDVSGFVAPDAGRADLSVPLNKLVVDEKALREEAGFDTQPTAADIAGTRHNMLTRVLEAQRFPLAQIHIVRRDASVLDVTLTLHGTTRTYVVPSTIAQTSDGLIVSGSMQLRQSDFGIVPFSVLKGAIRVQDELALRFRIAAANDKPASD